MGDARRAALAVLEKCRRSGAWSDAVLGAAMDKAGLTGSDRALCTSLCYGVMQNLFLLDHVLQSASTPPLKRAEPKVLDILRIAAYQLLFMTKIPASAAVNEAVNLSRALGFSRAAGYVNAVLRRVAANPAVPEIRGDALSSLSIRYSHPRWLVSELCELLDEAEAEEFLKCDNATVPTYLQVNMLKTDSEVLRAALAGEGIGTKPHPWLPDCLIADGGDLARGSAFQNGLFYVQDPAARLAALAAEPRPGQKILDVCAAPGGKSFAAAMASGGKAEITACDLHENKLKRIRAGAERLGLSIETLARDARENRPDWRGAFDLVLADVPCSGLGVIRKKPDIRYKDPADFTALPGLQTDIIKNAARYVAPGGALLYSTCTVRREENEDVIVAFLRQNEDFSPEDFNQLPGGRSSEDGMLRLWPQRDGTDGFFIAKLRKKAI